MNRKIVFFDIDNTIWRADQVIPESTGDAVRRLKENGHYAFLNSGRARGFINDPALLSLGFDGIVGGCGCYLEINGKILKNDLIPQEIITETIRILKENRLPLILEGWTNLYLDPEDFRDDPYYRSLLARLQEGLLPITGHNGPWEINKISINQEDDLLANCIDQLIWYYDMISHGGHFIELVPKGHSKATGIDDVCEILGISLEDTFAIGDSINDYEMIEHAGCGIVMGNGSEDVKAIADYVTDTLENDGLAKALAHFYLI